MPTRIMPWILRSLLAATLVVAAAGQDATLRYPETRKSDTVDRSSGTAVPDPYRWLENAEAAETAAWVTAQNGLTFAQLGKLPVRDAYRRRLTSLWDYEKLGLPRREGGQLFYSKNTGLQRQSVLYRETAAGQPLVVLDPNVLSPDGSLALMTAAASPDARYLAYAVSEGGADFFELRIREIDTGRDLPDRVRWVKMSETSWTKDGRGFFYSRYPAPGEGRALTAANTGHQLCYHRVGTDQAQDLLVYQRPDHPEWIFQAHVSEEGRYVLIISARGTETNKRVFFIDLGNPIRPRVTAPVTPLLDSGDANYGFVGVRGSSAYLTTNLDAPNYRVIAADLTSASRGRVKSVVPEAPEVIDGATFGMGSVLAGGHLVVNYLSDVKGRLRLFDLEGKAVGELPLPGIGAVSGLQGRDDTSEVFYTFSSYLAPTTVYRRDLKAGVTTAFHQPRTAFEPSRYETRQVFYPSKDGTRVPMFITARKGLTLDGSHPTVLYAYGGFGINVTPTFQPEVAAWLEQGGVYAVPNLRGGGEFGEDWHKAGMLSKKQNVFDDFIAAAEYLIREKITSSRTPRHPRVLQRWPARRRNHGAATRTICCRLSRRRRHGHAAVPQLHDRCVLDHGVRLGGRPRAVRAISTATRRCTTSRPAPATRRRS